MYYYNFTVQALGNLRTGINHLRANHESVAQMLSVWNPSDRTRGLAPCRTSLTSLYSTVCLRFRKDRS
eukprot:9466460-Pyramimonas_sp.AAC.1